MDIKKGEYLAGKYDIEVIGAGHAGCEAGLVAARLGMKTLLFSIEKEQWLTGLKKTNQMFG